MCVCLCVCVCVCVFVGVYISLYVCVHVYVFCANVSYLSVLELGDIKICLSVLVTKIYHDIPVYSAKLQINCRLLNCRLISDYSAKLQINFVQINLCYSCIMHRLICTNL